jgi:AcrR family transcriptional regulator
MARRRDSSIDTKHAIERAALQLFVERGVAETSTRDIARAAGVSLGAMYNHYVSKEELAWSLFSRNTYQLGLELRQCAQQHATLEGKLNAMVACVFETFDGDWVLLSYVFCARHQYLRRMTRQGSNPFVVFRSVLADAMVRREIPRQDLDMATSLVVGAIIQMIDTRIFWHWRVDRPMASSAGHVAAACLRIVRG